MALQDYIVQFTDATNGSFVIKPFTVDGPSSPIACGPFPPSEPTPDPRGISANTSLILPGKGLFEYGEIWANNIVHMLEHFANFCEPAYAIQGQIWFKNDTSELYVCVNPAGATFNDKWKEIVLAGLINSDLDMNGFKIINLANATNPTDALNMQTGDSRYVNITGDTMTGFLTLNADPTNALHAATKQYVDAVVAGSGYVLKTGDTMTGPLNMSGNFITNIANAINPTDALNIQTADALYVNASGGDTMLGTYNIVGALNLSTGNLTLSGGSNINVNSGNILITSGLLNLSSSNFVITGTSIVSMGSNRVQDVASPLTPTDAANKQYVDSFLMTLPSLSFNVRRHVLTYSTNPVLLPVNLGLSYTVEANKLTVYVNGVKQVADTRGTAFIRCLGVTGGAMDTGLAASTTYYFDINVDGTPQTLSITTGASTPITFDDLTFLINGSVSTAFPGAAARFFLFGIVGLIGVYSPTTGLGSSCALSETTSTPRLLTDGLVLSFSSGYDNTQSNGASYAYKEGSSPFPAAFTTSTAFTFNVGSEPTLGSVIEVIVSQ